MFGFLFNFVVQDLSSMLWVKIEWKGERGGGGGVLKDIDLIKVLYLLTFFAFDKNTHLDD